MTHRGDVEAIHRDVGKLTEDWLEEHMIMIFGKPYADFYIGDKAVNVTDFEESGI